MGDKNKLAAAVVAFTADIAKQFKEVYKTYPEAVVKYLDNLHKD